MNLEKLLEISEAQKRKLKTENKMLRQRMTELQDKIKELLSKK